MIIASLPGYEVIKLLGAEILSFMKQYSYNLINRERSDHNLITFNFRKYRKLNYFITLSFITWEQSDHHLIRFIVPMAALGATSPGLFFPNRRLF